MDNIPAIEAQAATLDSHRRLADKMCLSAKQRETLFLTSILLQRHDPVQDDLVIRAVGIHSLWEARISNMTNMNKDWQQPGQLTK